MKPKSKKILIISLVLFIIGAVITVIGIVMGGRPGVSVSRTGIHATNSRTKVYELEKTKLDEFSKISLNLDYTDMEILPSEDNNCYLEYTLSGDSGKPVYGVKNGIFSITQVTDEIDFISWGIMNFSFGENGFKAPQYFVRLYIPKDLKLEGMKIDNDSGDVFIDGIKADTAKLDLEYGKVDIKDTVVTSLDMVMESTDVNIKDSQAGKFILDAEYGKMKLENAAFTSADIKQESCDISMDAAKLENLQYTGEYGDLELILPESIENYTFDVKQEYGKIRLPEGAPKGLYTDEDDINHYSTEGKGNGKIQIQAESVDINIKNR